MVALWRQKKLRNVGVLILSWEDGIHTMGNHHNTEGMSKDLANREKQHDLDFKSLQPSANYASVPLALTPQP